MQTLACQCRLEVHLRTLCVFPASKAVNSSGTGARHRDSLTRSTTGRAESKLSPSLSPPAESESESAPGSQRVGGSGPQAGIGLQLVQGRRGRARAGLGGPAAGQGWRSPSRRSGGHRAAAAGPRSGPPGQGRAGAGRPDFKV